MYNKWKTLLNRPLTGILDSSGDKYLLAVIFTVFTPIFMLIFQPFGVNNYDPSGNISAELLTGVAIVGMIQGLSILVTEFLITPYLIRPDSVQKLILHILFVLFFLSSSTFLIYNVLGNFHDWSWSSFFEFQWNIAFLGIIPFGATLLYFQYRNTKEVAESMIIHRSKPDDLISLRSSSGKDKFSLTLDKLLYIEARDNYVAIFYRDNDRISEEMIRIPLKDAESQCDGYPVYRCHRSFLVNISQVEKAKGNRHKLELFLSGTEVSVPVSRSYVAEIENKLDIRHK